MVSSLALTVGAPAFALANAPTLPSGGLPYAATDPPLEFDVDFDPAAEGEQQGRIELQVEQSGYPLAYALPLAARVDALGQAHDHFVQTAQPFNLLLQVRGGNGMNHIAQELDAALPVFFQYLTRAGVAFHFAVTDADVAGSPPQPAAAFITTTLSPDPILTEQSYNFANQAMDKVTLIIAQRSGFTDFFDVAVRALTPPLISGPNAGFLRPQARLAVVAISDYQETSGQLDLSLARTFSEYYALLQQIKGPNHPELFSFSAITDYDPTIGPAWCSNNTNHDDGRFASMVALTQGFRAEACSDDWTVALQGVVQAAAGFRVAFPLGSLPEPGTLTVQVDGQAVPGAWTYNEAANAVRFAADQVPLPGAQVDLDYLARCGP